MKTAIKRAENETVKTAANMIKDGGVVIFPTETVYGMAALAADENAVKRIYEIKGRNEKKPLSIFLSDAADIFKIAKISKEDERHIKNIADRFWPGPLTLILKRRAEVSDVVSAGLHTVGIRIPAHHFALAVAKEVNAPLVVTSANISGKEAAKDFEAVKAEFDGRVDMIIDGGCCGSGIASTVCEIEAGKINILREGAITKTELEEAMSG